MTREPQSREEAYRRWRRAFYCSHHPHDRKHTRYGEFLWSAWSTKRTLRRLEITPSEHELLICFHADFKRMLASECATPGWGSLPGTCSQCPVLLLALASGYLEFTRKS